MSGDKTAAMENESHKEVLESLFERTTDYVETRLNLAKLKIVKKTSGIVSNVMSKVVLGVIFTFFILMLNIALGLWLGEILHKNYYGFFALAGFYFIVGLIIYAGRNAWIRTPIANSIIKTVNK